MRYSKPYHDAVALQRLIMEKSASAEAKDLANIAASFVRLELLKLRMRMKPAPKPIDVSKQKKSDRPNVSLE